MADEGTARVKVNGEVYVVKFDDLELDEIGTVEDLTGRSVQYIDWESARGMQGLAWIAMHRRDPRFTIQEAGKLKFSAFEDLGEDEEERPTEDAPDEKSGGNSSGKGSTRRTTASARSKSGD